MSILQKLMCRLSHGAILAFIVANPNILMAQSGFKDIAKEKGIEPALLYAVALAESARLVEDGKVMPWPWTINSSKYGSRYFENRKDAEDYLKGLLKEGVENIDIGLMQVNLQYHPMENPLVLLDPGRNIQVGAEILRQALNTTKDPILAVGRYHSRNIVRSYSYGYRVWQIYYRVRPYLRLR